jgi:hypothetical protein
MCNLYSMTSNAEAIRQFANHMLRRATKPGSR